MNEFLGSVSILLVLLNPFLVILYLIDLLEKLDDRAFRRVLTLAGVIACVAFCCFAILGDALFSDIHANFASFQIFGGVVFLLIGIQFVFRGPSAIEVLRGDSQHIVGAVAMPVLIGPGTISASVVIGQRHEPLYACAAVVAATTLSIMIPLALKSLFDYVRPRHESLVTRYIEIAGRISALYIGTVSVEMIMDGIRTWTRSF